MSTLIDQQQTKLKEAIKEAFYASGSRLLRPVVQTLNEEYPSNKRLLKSPQFDQAVFDEHDTKFRRARNHLYEQRNLVQRKWLTRYIVKVGEGTDSVATAELRQIIVDGALDRLYENLVAYIPMLVSVANSKPLQATVTNVFNLEVKKLTDVMAGYSATFAPEVRPMNEELE
jgi:hypothetical protein